MGNSYKGLYRMFLMLDVCFFRGGLAWALKAESLLFKSKQKSCKKPKKI
jgi:hypothetical protein